MTRGHVFKTTDGGTHWQATATSGSGWVGANEALTADPRHPGTLYAGTNVAVYKTVDGGRSWRPFNRGLFVPHGGRRVCYSPGGGKPYCVKQPFGTPGTTSSNRLNGRVLDVAVDPVHTNVVYSASDRVRKSTDGGRSWKTVFPPQHTRTLSRSASPSPPPARSRSTRSRTRSQTGAPRSTSRPMRAGRGRRPARLCWLLRQGLQRSSASAGTAAAVRVRRRSRTLPARRLRPRMPTPRRSGRYRPTLGGRSRSRSTRATRRSSTS